jgi:hypothetical protein
MADVRMDDNSWLPGYSANPNLLGGGALVVVGAGEMSVEGGIFYTNHIYPEALYLGVRTAGARTHVHAHRARVRVHVCVCACV